MRPSSSANSLCVDRSESQPVTGEWNVGIGKGGLSGILVFPQEPADLLIFVHGSGSSRFSPRKTYPASQLQTRGLATILFDLLTAEDSEDRRNVFDIALLAARAGEAIGWARRDYRTSRLPMGRFGASTGAGAAIAAAAAQPSAVAAVVSRGGRPDLAGDALERRAAPTLLIVGGEDRHVIALNEEAQRRMSCRNQLVIVPDATHVFEEPGTLDEALSAAADWFEVHLGRAVSAQSSAHAGISRQGS